MPALSDDKIEGPRLSSAFKMTCRAWKFRFNIDYTHCGCPIPGDSIGTKLKRLIGMQKPAPFQLVPYDRSDLLSATHPSDHNVVNYTPLTISAHTRMIYQYNEMLKEKEQQAKKAAEKTARKGRDLGLNQPHCYDHCRSSSTDDNWSERHHDFFSTFIVPVPIESRSAEICVAVYSGSSFLSFGNCGGCK